EDIRKQRDSEIRGRGHRSKGDVRYDDGLTEEQWLDAIENDDVDLAELVTEKQRHRQSKDADGEDTDGSESKPLPSRKRGRTKRSDQYDDDTSSNDPVRRSRQKTKAFDEDSTRKKRKAKDPYGPDPLAPHVRETMTHLFQQLYDVVENCIDPEEDDRQRCLLFLELPSKKIYPQYYIMIQQPIAMNIIKKRMRTSFYKTILQFRDDFHLMFNNARYFNEEGSWVYVDANKMQEAFDSKFQELCPNGSLPGGYGNNGMNTPEGDPQEVTSKPLHMNSGGSANIFETNLPQHTYQGLPNPLQPAEDKSPHYPAPQAANVPVNVFSVSQPVHPENVPYTNSYTNSAANVDVRTIPRVDKNATPYHNNPTASSSSVVPPLWRMMDDDNYDEA
ncbi:ATP-dependent DNA helicase Snf21, partial [Basidiobolus ranarum]